MKEKKQTNLKLCTKINMSFIETITKNNVIDREKRNVQNNALEMPLILKISLFPKFFS